MCGAFSLAFPEPSPPVTKSSGMLCRASGRRVGYKENSATGKSVFEDLMGSNIDGVHLASLPPPQASKMLVQPTSRGNRQPPALCQCRLCDHLEEGETREEADPEEIVRRKSCKIFRSSQSFPCPLKAPASTPSSRLPEHSPDHPSAYAQHVCPCYLFL